MATFRISGRVIDVNDYSKIFGKEVSASQSVDWVAVEHTFGSVLPDDYKYYAERYPALLFDSLITILHPCSSDSFANLPEHGRRIIDQWSMLERQSEGEFPYAIFPAPGGLLPWGYDDNNGHYFWRTSGSPSEWNVVVVESLQWWDHAGGFGSF